MPVAIMLLLSLDTTATMSVAAFSPPTTLSSLPRLFIHHQNLGIRHRHQFHVLNFREAADDTDEKFDSTTSTATTTKTKSPASLSSAQIKNGFSTSPAKGKDHTNSDDVSDKKDANGGVNDKSTNNTVNSKSAQRLLKAKRLLEMAQVSPSQRLEMEESRKSNNNNNGSFNSTNTNINGKSNSMNDDTSSTTVVPMGSYSLRFGGSGSLEEELEDVYAMRMADTFDSVDNLVDSKSLLPGGRWVDTNINSKSNGAAMNGDAGEQSSLSKSTSSTDIEYTPYGQVAEPTVRYDPVAAEKLLFIQPTKWLVRNVQIAFPFGLWVGGVVLDALTGQEKSNRTNRAKQLNSIIAGLGPAIIKAGQALASRPDLLPGEYLDELQKLQDDVPTFSNDIAFRIVEEELKQEFGDVFELVEPEPVAGKFCG